MRVKTAYASSIPNANEFFKYDGAFTAQYISDGFQLFSKINLLFVSTEYEKYIKHYEQHIPKLPVSVTRNGLLRNAATTTEKCSASAYLR